MADLFSTLSLGARALQAHRTAAATASHNLENASTAGYARQRAQLGTNEAERVGNSFVGTGVVVQGVSQARDRFVEARLPQLFASSSAAQARTAALASVSAFDPQGGVDMGTTMSSFFASLRGLQTRPDDPSVRKGAVAAADAVAAGYRRAAADVEGARAAIDQDLTAKVPQANQALAAVADLNRRIRVASAGGAAPNDLLDERQRAVDAAVQLTGAVVIPNDDGDIGLALPNGKSLVNGDRAAALSTGVDVEGRVAVKVNGDDTAGGDFGGVFGGAFAARDDDLGAVAKSLDDAANAFANAVNAAHVTGFAKDGSSGRNLFVGTSAKDLVVNAEIKANPSLLAVSSDPANPSSTGTLTSLLAVEGNDPVGAFADVVADFGVRANSAEAEASASDALLQHGLGLREAASGVSVDEELVELQRAERAFQAASKVIQTADGMLETLLNLGP